MVRHALQLPKLTATQIITTDAKINFLILFGFLVNKINDLLLTECAYKNASRRVFRLCARVYADAAPF